MCLFERAKGVFAFHTKISSIIAILYSARFFNRFVLLDFISAVAAAHPHTHTHTQPDRYRIDNCLMFMNDAEVVMFFLLHLFRNAHTRRTFHHYVYIHTTLC